MSTSTGLKAQGSDSWDETRELCKEFARLYQSRPRIFRAPGRVNLIGEHTDYNDGFVMPAAIGHCTYVAAHPRNDRRVRVYSLNFQQSREFDLEAIAPGRTGNWDDYVRGTAAILDQTVGRLRGADLAIFGNVPIGAGLSSSASLEIATGLALLEISGSQVDRRALAMAAQKAEHVFAGTHCGIMDQFISCFGSAGHCLMLDCRSLEQKLLPLPTGAKMVICNTKVKHQLASGEYNTRRAECEQGVEHFRRYLPHVRALRDVTVSDLEKYGDGLPHVIRRRCRHVVTEDDRVQESADALTASDLTRFGKLMAESHRSLRDDFEVSCKELDTMVEIASRCPGVYGSRMTGGGFGGCTINLVKSEAVEGFVRQVQAEYERATGISPEQYVCTAADGASEIVVA